MDTFIAQLRMCWAKFILISTFGLIITSCSDDNDAIPNGQIIGVVFENGTAVINAEVELSDATTNLRTLTNDRGEFSFQQVEAGSYNLKTSKVDSGLDGRFVEKNTKVETNGQGVYVELLLPEPVYLIQPEETIDNNSITLKWSASQEPDFREYKVYRTWRNSALDETTGELIHVSTNSEDTIFFDGGLDEMGGLNAGASYFYRVYIMNDYGKLGGSNVLEAFTKEFENEITHTYNLIKFKSFAGVNQIKGISYDGEYLWILYFEADGGYYDNNIVTLVQYNYVTSTNIKSFTFNNKYQVPYGLTYENGFLWIYYDNDKLVKIDASSGEVVKALNIEYGIQDIEFNSGSLYTSHYYDLIQKINPITGEVEKTFNNPFGTGANWGIAMRNNEIWLSNRASDKIAILDSEGGDFGIAVNDILSSWNNGFSMCFMGDQIVLADYNRVYICNIE